MASMLEHPEITPLAAFLHRAIEASDKTQRQIAAEIGMNSPNFISMLKHAKSKFPLAKVLATATALRVDAAHLMRLALEQYWPRQLHAVEEIFGLVVSSNERRLLLVIRALIGNSDPAFDEKAIVRFLRDNDPRWGRGVAA